MSNPFSLKGKVALVTGAGAGIGRVTAQTLSEAGAATMISDIDQATCDRAASELREMGLTVSSIQQDVADEASWQTTLAKTIQVFGGLDVLVNNAGIYIGGPLVSNSLDQLQKLNSVNVNSVFLGMKYAAEVMRPGGSAGKGGSIINLSSAAGLVGVPGHSAYGSTKGAVRLYTKHAAVEFGFMRYGIRVNSVHPGPIATAMGDQVFEGFVEVGMAPDVEAAKAMFNQMVPLGCIGEALDVAYMIRFLASDASRYCTGGEFVVDGGITAC